MNLPTDHPMHLGHDPGAFLPKADVVIVIDSAVPWMARNHTPRKDAKVIHISADPLETRYPFRELEADLLVTGNSLRGHEHAARDARRGDEGQEDRDRKPAQGAGGDARRDRRQAPQADRDGEGPDPDPPGVARQLHQPGEIGGRHRHQRARRAARHAQPHQAAELYGRASVRRARLRPGRRARRQARGARARGDRHLSATAPTCSAIPCPITTSRAPKSCRP